MLLTYKNHKPLRYKSQVKQQFSEASGSILVVDVVEPDLHDLDLRMLHRRHGKLPVLRARAMPIRPASVTIITSFFIVCPFCRFSSVSWLSVLYDVFFHPNAPPKSRLSVQENPDTVAE